MRMKKILITMIMKRMTNYSIKRNGYSLDNYRIMLALKG